MKSGLTLDNITNGLLTIQRLKQPSHIYPDKLSLIQDTLSSVISFLPETRGLSYSEILSRCNIYSTAYRGIKHQVRDMKRGHVDISQLLSSLKLIVPLLENRQKLYMDKVVKIAEIITK